MATLRKALRQGYPLLQSATRHYRDHITLISCNSSHPFLYIFQYIYHLIPNISYIHYICSRQNHENKHQSTHRATRRKTHPKHRQTSRAAKTTISKPNFLREWPSLRAAPSTITQTQCSKTYIAQHFRTSMSPVAH